MLSPHTSTFMLLCTKNAACVSEGKLITEQAFVKWVLASLCQPSKLVIRYPAVAIGGPNQERYYFACFGPIFENSLMQDIINACPKGPKQAG